MSETAEVTADELRLKRIVAGSKMILNFVHGRVDATGEVDQYAMNLARDFSEEERLRLLRMLLMTFPGDLAEQAVTACFEDAGWPTSGLLGDPRDDAKLWAELASEGERKAYAGACLLKMSPENRKAIIDWARKR